jgi:hypothetical protein
MVTTAIQRSVPSHISTSVHNKQYVFSQKLFIIF